MPDPSMTGRWDGSVSTSKIRAAGRGNQALD
jgi:hypothetical protein